MGSECFADGEIIIGPFGGTAGDTMYSFKVRNAITQVLVTHSREAIESLRFRGNNGSISEYSPKLGGGFSRDARTEKIDIDFPSEFLTGIGWTIGHQDNYEVIKLLRFYTSVTDYGPFGLETGTKFSFRQKGAAIVGFYGKSGWLIDCIGFYLKSLCSVFATVSSAAANTKRTCSALEGLGLSSSAIARNPGPWGGNYGRTFDDGVFAAIKTIRFHLCSKSSAVSALQFEYLKGDGSVVWSLMHGNSGSEVVRKVVLAHGESILAVEGYYGKIEGITSGFSVIRSLTFHTSGGKYGPVGKEIGMFFSSGALAWRIVGFFGRSGEYLESIGIHSEYVELCFGDL